MSDLAPIVLFVYNRPVHTRRTLESLMANELAEKSELFIYADGPKTDAPEETIGQIAEVRKVIREKQWCGKVTFIEAGTNKGLADSIISGVTEIVNRYCKIIVLEDDLVLSRGFLKYMNDALELYANEEKVMHVSGYMYPVKGELPNTFFVNLATCWGWGTWKRAWEHFESNPSVLLEKINKTGSVSRFNLEDGYDWYSHLMANVDGRMKTWAIRWYASFYLINGFCLHPQKSLVRNIGNDCTGVHCGTDDILLNQQIGEIDQIYKIPTIESSKARVLIKEYFTGSQKVMPRKHSATSYIATAIKSLYKKLRKGEL